MFCYNSIRIRFCCFFHFLNFNFFGHTRSSHALEFREWCGLPYMIVYFLSCFWNSRKSNAFNGSKSSNGSHRWSLAWKAKVRLCDTLFMKFSRPFNIPFKRSRQLGFWTGASLFTLLIAERRQETKYLSFKNVRLCYQYAFDLFRC